MCFLGITQLLLPVEAQISSCTLGLPMYINVQSLHTPEIIWDCAKSYCEVTLTRVAVTDRHECWDSGCFRLESTNSKIKCKRPGLQATSNLSGKYQVLLLHPTQWCSLVPHNFTTFGWSAACNWVLDKSMCKSRKCSLSFVFESWFDSNCAAPSILPLREWLYWAS